MGVSREVIEKLSFRGGAVPLRARRSAAGAWSVDVQMLIDIPIDGGARTLEIRKTIMVRADQVGRKKMAIRLIPKRGAR